MPSRPPQHRPPWFKPHVESEQQRKREHDRNRPSSSERGYDSDWRKLRSVYIKQHPTCARVGCTAPSVDVDHIESIAERPDLRLEWSNLRALCRSHHSQRTALEQGFARRRP